MLSCPECGRIMLDSTSDGGYKLRSRMVIFHGDKAVALCPTCKTEVDVPVRIGEVDKALPKRKLVVEEGK